MSKRKTSRSSRSRTSAARKPRARKTAVRRAPRSRTTSCPPGAKHIGHQVVLYGARWWIVGCGRSKGRPAYMLRNMVLGTERWASTATVGSALKRAGRMPAAPRMAARVQSMRSTLIGPPPAPVGYEPRTTLPGYPPLPNWGRREHNPRGSCSQGRKRGKYAGCGRRGPKPCKQPRARGRYARCR